MSVDVGLLARLIVDAFEKKESFELENRMIDLQGIVQTDQIKFIETKLAKYNTARVLSFLLSLVIGLCALYLSWTCNTSLGYSVVMKSIFGSLAFFFGFIYIVLYMLFRYDTCKKILLNV